MLRTKSVTKSSILTAALAGLEAQWQRLEAQITQVRGLLGKRRVGRPRKVEAQVGVKRQLSAAARKRISDAQKRRWEAFRMRRAA